MIRTWTQTIALAGLFAVWTGSTVYLNAQEPTPAAELTEPAEVAPPAEISALNETTTSESYAPDAVYSDGVGMGCHPWEYGDPALFHNFYAPNNCGGMAASLYIAPRPVPAVVGHTYYTYQPLMPHEFTYPHYRTYRAYYNNGQGMNRTKVVWYCNPVTEILKGAHQALRIPR
jgi:hypothetical protein